MFNEQIIDLYYESIDNWHESEKLRSDSMEIYLTDNLRITSDSLNFILEESYKSKNKETKTLKWKTVGYYPVYELLLKRLLEKELRQSNINSLLQVENVLNSLVEKIIIHLKDVK